jgi:hypothetical protein
MRLLRLEACDPHANGAMKIRQDATRGRLSRDEAPRPLLKAHPEQVLPTLAQMREQRSFVRQQLVQAAVERILLRQRIV